jgi:serine/threonine protein kinase
MATAPRRSVLQVIPGIVRRDLKPKNIMVTSDGMAKVRAREAD